MRFFAGRLSASISGSEEPEIRRPLLAACPEAQSRDRRRANKARRFLTPGLSARLLM